MFTRYSLHDITYHLDELGFQNDSGKQDFVSSLSSKVEIVDLLVMSLLGNLAILFSPLLQVFFVSNAKTSLTKPSEWYNGPRLNLKYISILKLCKKKNGKVHILRRPQNFVKSSPYFWLQYIQISQNFEAFSEYLNFIKLGLIDLLKFGCPPPLSYPFSCHLWLLYWETWLNKQYMTNSTLAFWSKVQIQ